MQETLFHLIEQTDNDVIGGFKFSVMTVVTIIITGVEWVVFFLIESQSVYCKYQIGFNQNIDSTVQLISNTRANARKIDVIST